MIPESELDSEKKELKKLALDDKKNVAKEESSDEDIATKNGKWRRGTEDSLDPDGEKIKDREKNQYCAKLQERLKALIEEQKEKVLTVIFVIRLQRDGCCKSCYSESIFEQ